MSKCFALGQAISVNSSIQKTAQPHDSLLRLNRIVDSKNSDPTATIYSIDPNKFLELLETDRLSELFLTTLAARPVRDSIGIWDTLFNNSSRQGMSACILLADAEFRPIPQKRVVSTSRFLNFGMSVTRANLNQVEIGDRIGVAIHDMVHGLVYILLYVIEDFCVIPSPERDSETRPTLIPTVNVKMEHALRVDYDGVGSVVNMDDDVPYDADKAQPFVNHLNGVVSDVASSYPFKPHFLPITPASLNRGEIEAGLLTDAEKAEDISYDDFDLVCRQVYQDAKMRHDRNKNGKGDRNGGGKHDRRRPGARNPRGNSGPKHSAVPTLQAHYTSDKSLIIKFDPDNNPTGAVYRLSEDEYRSRAITETFLTNQDLDGVLLAEHNQIMLLSPGLFGDNALLRYFSANF